MSYYFDPVPFLVSKGDVVYSDDLNDPLNSLGVQMDALVDDIRNDMRLKYGPDSGVANAYVVTLGLPLTGYTDGLTIWLKPSATNTGASTININSLGVVPIVSLGGRALNADELKVNYWVALKYLAGSFQVVSPTVDAGQAVIDAEAAASAALTSEGNASDSEIAAGLSASAALTSEGNASDSETAAVTSENVAKSYASGESPLGEPGTGSAAYWAAIAQINTTVTKKNLIIDPEFIINIEDEHTPVAGKYIRTMWLTHATGVTPSFIEYNGAIQLGRCVVKQRNDDIDRILETGFAVYVSVSVESGSVLVNVGGEVSKVVTPSTPLTYQYWGGDGFIYVGDTAIDSNFSGLNVVNHVAPTVFNDTLITEEENKVGRYLRMISGGGVVSLGLGFRPNVASSVDFTIQLPVEMSHIPTVTSAGLTVEQLISPYNIDGTSSISVKNTENNSLISLRATTSNDLFTYGEILNIRLPGSSYYIKFDAR